MSYSLTIGNATPYHAKEDGELIAGWSVAGEAHPDAPTFSHDEMTGNGNARHPSYSAWTDFTVAVGLHDLFYAKWEGLLSRHPGCALLTPAHGEAIADALAKYHRTLPPGFAGYGKLDEESQTWSTPDEGKYDANLARLIWLDFWVRHALTTCETPAMENT